MRTLREFISLQAIRRRSENKARARREAELNAMFQVEERRGSLWLLCGNIAIKEVDKYASSAEVAEQLELSRQAAINFEK